MLSRSPWLTQVHLHIEPMNLVTCQCSCHFKIRKRFLTKVNLTSRRHYTIWGRYLPLFLYIFENAHFKWRQGRLGVGNFCCMWDIEPLGFWWLYFDTSRKRGGGKREEVKRRCLLIDGNDKRHAVGAVSPSFWDLDSSLVYRHQPEMSEVYDVLISW